MVKRIGSMILCILMMFGGLSIILAADVRSVIAPQFDSAGIFSEGLATVMLNGKWGYIDKTGKIVISCKYDWVGNFSYGKAFFGMKEGDSYKYGFLDKTGKEIQPCVYDDIVGRENGYVVVVKKGPTADDDKNGLLGPDGREIIPCEYSYVDAIYDGMIRVEKRKLLEKDGIISRYDTQMGFYNINGKLAIPLVYQSASGFKDGVAWVQNNNKYGFVDQTDKVVIPLQYERVTQFHNGLAQAVKNGQNGFIDKNGTLVKTFPDFFVIWEYWDGVGGIERNSKHGFIDQNGKIIVPFEYDETSAFNDGMALVAKGEDEIYDPADDPDSTDYIVLTTKKFGYVNTAGKLVVPLKYDYAMQFINGFGIVGVGGSGAGNYYMNGKLGYVDTNGKEIVPCQYEYVSNFREGMGRVSVDGTGDMGDYRDGKWGFVNNKGVEVIPCKYDEAWDFCEGLAKVGIDGQYGYVDKSGREVVPCIYDDVDMEFKDGMALVLKDGKIGFIDSAGNETVPRAYTKAVPFFEGMAAYMENGKVGFLSSNVPVTPSVVASLSPGSYTGMQTITLTCPIPDAEIYVSINNGEPWFRIYSNQYTAPIKIYDSTTITATAYKRGMQRSPAVTFTYEIKQEKVQPVTAGVKPGTYSKPQTIALRCATEGAVIYYTTDGSAPGVKSMKYTKPIVLNKSGNIRSVAVKDGMCGSNPVTFSYGIKNK